MDISDWSLSVGILLGFFFTIFVKKYGSFSPKSEGGKKLTIRFRLRQKKQVPIAIKFEVGGGGSREGEVRTLMALH